MTKTRQKIFGTELTLNEDGVMVTPEAMYWLDRVPTATTLDWCISTWDESTKSIIVFKGPYKTKPKAEAELAELKSKGQK